MTFLMALLLSFATFSFADTRSQDQTWDPCGQAYTGTNHVDPLVCDNRLAPAS